MSSKSVGSREFDPKSGGERVGWQARAGCLALAARSRHRNAFASKERRRVRRIYGPYIFACVGMCSCVHGSISLRAIRSRAHHTAIHPAISSFRAASGADTRIFEEKPSQASYSCVMPLRVGVGAGARAITSAA